MKNPSRHPRQSVRALQAFASAFLIAIGCSEALSQDKAIVSKPIQLPGLKSTGETLLPNGWSLKPVGDQIEMGDFPSHIELSPDGQFAAILHS